MKTFIATAAALLFHVAAVALPAFDLEPQTKPGLLRETIPDDPAPPADPPPADPPVADPSPLPPPPAYLHPSEQNPHPHSLIKHTATSIGICTDDGSRCKFINMPAALGTVDRYVHGPFVTYEIAQASWIAINQQEAHICYLANADDSITCVPIKASVPSMADIRYRNPGSDLGVLTFERKEPTEDREGYYLVVRVFSQAVMAAATELQAKAQSTLSPESKQPRPAPLKIDNTVPVTPDSSYWESMEGATWSEEKMPVVTISDKLNRIAAINEHPDRDFFPPFLNLFPEPIRYEPPKPGWPLGWMTQTPTTRCIFKGFVIHCTAPKAPPVTDSLEADPRPIQLPAWSICKATGFFCAASDEEKRAEDMEKRRIICEMRRDNALDGCERREYDYRMRKACKDDAWREYGDCLASASRRNEELYGN